MTQESREYAFVGAACSTDTDEIANPDIEATDLRVERFASFDEALAEITATLKMARAEMGDERYALQGFIESTGGGTRQGWSLVELIDGTFEVTGPTPVPAWLPALDSEL